ncbi:hypothetical protein L3556_06030 [Candidatus Synechococcus calcipolaris G9]|uniref:Uncharacterized protein n=1 Tax=Candidatus Synechococcus calcipolaris G9 TaxID=1497997 RepID=A0ABT6EXJ4_9SYNE|nr:hypothetical protein [Candidatus Synechococcus calcipolaris]MDG2990493.1 hypothetical protein [Candidatus Synechococcus calcipolaris G9]
MRQPIVLSVSLAALLGLGTALSLLSPRSPHSPPLSAGLTMIDPALAQDSWGIESRPSQSPSSPSEVALNLEAYTQYRSVIERTRTMVGDANAQRLAQQYGLNILNVTWEDTGRYQNSAVGPNISDMTIQVQQFNPQSRSYDLSLMPVIRFPNFTDKTADIPLDRFFIRVGNEKGRDLKRISLREYLGNFRKYLHNSRSWKGSGKSLLAPRDSHALVSAQACFLPIPQGREAIFNPVLFNYQSYEKNPAVLAILITRQGTSATIIDNQRDGFEAGRTWGQRLFFNKNGERASLTGQRASDVSLGGVTVDPGQGISSEEAEAAGLNMVMLIQVPLKQQPRTRQSLGGVPLMMPAAPSAMESDVAGRSSNVEAAVISHGEVEGPFTEIDNLAIERDPDFPIRVTVQFYKATDNGVVSEADISHINDQIAKVYSNADYVGSLVVDGDTGRPTEYDGPKNEPPDWWYNFWQRFHNQ